MVRIGTTLALVGAILAGLSSLGHEAGSPRGDAVLRVPEDYRTIQAAVNAASSGDVIDIAQGTYRGTVVVDKPVTLRARRFDAARPQNNSTVLDGGGRSVVVIPPGVAAAPVLVGLVIENGDNGIEASSPFTVKHSYLRGNDDGVDYSKGAGGLCKGNLLVGQNDDAIDFDHLVRDVAVVGNRIADASDDGIEIRLHDDAIPSTAELSIRRNEIKGSGEDGIQLIDYAKDTNRVIIVRRNLIRNAAMAGIGMMGGGNTTEDFSGAGVDERVEVFNNTLLHNARGISGGDAVVAVNNIFEHHVVALSRVDGRSIASYNLFAHNRVNDVSSNVVLSTSVRRPAKLDAKARLEPDSPAIDAGTAHFRWAGRLVLDLPPSDYYGKRPDIGWYESRR